MPVQRLREFLDKNHVPYETIPHAPAYTTQEVAAAAHIRGQEVAKTVMVKLDGTIAMAVLPANFQVDLELLRHAARAGEVKLASEEEFRGRFPGCEVGAMPPFGNLYGLEVYAARKLAEDETIAFNAGTHGEMIRLAWRDFERLVQPRIVDLCLLPVAA